MKKKLSSVQLSQETHKDSKRTSTSQIPETDKILKSSDGLEPDMKTSINELLTPFQLDDDSHTDPSVALPKTPQSPTPKVALSKSSLFFDDLKVTEKEVVIFISIDFDSTGDLFSSLLALQDPFENYPDILATLKQLFVKFIQDEIAKITTEKNIRVIVLNGSLRQFHLIDQLGHDQNMNGSCFETLGALCQQNGWEFNTFLFPDVFHKLEPGTSYREIKYSCPRLDRSKFSIVQAQLNYAAKLIGAGHNAYFLFIDDGSKGEVYPALYERLEVSRNKIPNIFQSLIFIECSWRTSFDQMVLSSSPTATPISPLKEISSINNNGKFSGFIFEEVDDSDKTPYILTPRQLAVLSSKITMRNPGSWNSHLVYRFLKVLNQIQNFPALEEEQESFLIKIIEHYHRITINPTLANWKQYMAWGQAEETVNFDAMQLVCPQNVRKLISKATKLNGIIFDLVGEEELDITTMPPPDIKSAPAEEPSSLRDRINHVEKKVQAIKATLEMKKSDEDLIEAVKILDILKLLPQLSSSEEFALNRLIHLVGSITTEPKESLAKTIYDFLVDTTNSIVIDSITYADDDNNIGDPMKRCLKLIRKLFHLEKESHDQQEPFSSNMHSIYHDATQVPMTPTALDSFMPRT